MGWVFVLSNFELGTSHVCRESVVQSVWWHDDGAGGAAPAHPGGPEAQTRIQHNIVRTPVLRSAQSQHT